MTEKYEPPNINTIHENEGQSALITFTDPTGITVVEGRNSSPGHLLIAESVNYPNEGRSASLDGLLLPQTKEGDVRVLELPPNYVTLAQAMNDAIGDNASEDSINLMRRLFTELGSSIRDLIDAGHLVPEGISYKNVIFSRDEEGPKLLPPIEVVPIEGDAQKVRHDVVTNLGASCMAGAANVTQANNVQAVFKGFEQALNG